MAEEKTKFRDLIRGTIKRIRMTEQEVNEVYSKNSIYELGDIWSDCVSQAYRERMQRKKIRPSLPRGLRMGHLEGD